MKCKDKEKSVLYDSGDWSNQGFPSQPPVTGIMFLCRFKRKKAIKRMRYVHKIGKLVRQSQIVQSVIYSSDTVVT